MNTLPNYLQVVIYEYAESAQRHVVLADIQYVGFVTEYVGWRNIGMMVRSANRIARINTGDFIRATPEARHRDYGQHRYIQL